MSYDLKSMNEDACRELMQELGEKPFRAAQIFEWTHKKLCGSIDEMTNLSLGLREKLKENCVFTRHETVECRISAIDGTEKYAFRLFDGNVIETVLMRYEHGNSVCISSQAGCRMGCTFCASTIGGKDRDLTAGEMLEQVYEITRVTGERVSNVVIMGTGEPLDNYDNVMSFIRLIGASAGYDMSVRNITLSTCGLVPMIYRMADEKLPVTLAISLHAPNDTLRKQYMPIANTYSIEEILRAAGTYFEKTGRRITCEYSLISGVNDSAAAGEELGQLLKGRGFHVNLIPVNPIKERKYRGSDVTSVTRFKNILEKYRINVTIRKKLGADIDSACGQLRRKVIEEGNLEN